MHSNTIPFETWSAAAPREMTWPREPFVPAQPSAPPRPLMATLTPAPAESPPLPLAELESRLLGLAGHVTAAQCRLLGLLAEFDRREGWAGPGLRSCAHWMSWRIGMSLRTAVEHLRVGHALELLPAIRESFAAGRLSYSKVRAITRIARPDTEQGLLDLALAGTTSHVERVVRAARQQGADPVVTKAQRALSWHWDDDGMLVLRGRLTAAEGAAVVAAIEATAAAAPTHPRSADDIPEALAVENTDPIAARRADALHTLAVAGGAGQRTRVVLHVNEASGTAQIEGGPAVPSTTAERMACDAEVQLLLSDRGTRLYLGRSHRLASPAQIAALCARDGRCCQFPGCTHARHLHGHHIRHWLRGGRTDIDNLVLLCSFHHSLVHDHGYRVVARTSGGFHFTRPDHTTIPTTGAQLRGDPDELIREHEQDGPDIDPENLTPGWAGERLDLTPILQYLLAREPETAAQEAA